MMRIVRRHPTLRRTGLLALVLLCFLPDFLGHGRARERPALKMLSPKTLLGTEKGRRRILIKYPIKTICWR